MRLLLVDLAQVFLLFPLPLPGFFAAQFVALLLLDVIRVTDALENSVGILDSRQAPQVLRGFHVLEVVQKASNLLSSGLFGCIEFFSREFFLFFFLLLHRFLLSELFLLVVVAISWLVKVRIIALPTLHSIFKFIRVMPLLLHRLTLSRVDISLGKGLSWELLALSNNLLLLVLLLLLELLLLKKLGQLERGLLLRERRLGARS